MRSYERHFPGSYLQASTISFRRWSMMGPVTFQLLLGPAFRFLMCSSLAALKFAMASSHVFLSPPFTRHRLSRSSSSTFEEGGCIAPRRASVVPLGRRREACASEDRTAEVDNQKTGFVNWRRRSIGSITVG